MSTYEKNLIDAVDTIPGFLFPVACAGTMALLNHQKARGIRGGLLEIGIFQGKYFSVLARSAQDTGERLLGIDNFMYAPEATARAALAGHPETRDAPVTIWAGASDTFTAASIESELGGKARFVSIDGSHAAADVANDLALAEAVLNPQGIIAVDDFLNPRALGVGEATHLHFRMHARLRPFALFGNKLFLAAEAMAPAMAAVIANFFLMSELTEGHAYRNLLALGRDQVEQDLWGTRLVVM